MRRPAGFAANPPRRAPSDCRAARDRAGHQRAWFVPRRNLCTSADEYVQAYTMPTGLVRRGPRVNAPHGLQARRSLLKAQQHLLNEAEDMLQAMPEAIRDLLPASKAVWPRLRALTTLSGETSGEDWDAPTALRLRLLGEQCPRPLGAGAA